MKITEEFKVQFPPFTKEKAAASGVSVKTSKDPLPLLDGDLLFLGGIPRTTDFEKGMPLLFYAEDGQEKSDDIADDTAIAANVRGKGLVVISGCSHAGIVNTVTYAQKVTGLNTVYAVMGGLPSHRRGYGASGGAHHRGVEEDRPGLYSPHALHREEGRREDRAGDAGEVRPQHVGDEAYLRRVASGGAAHCRDFTPSGNTAVRG